MRKGNIRGGKITKGGGEKKKGGKGRERWRHDPTL